MTIGQIMSYTLYSSINIILFLLLILGFAHDAYYQRDKLFGYLVSISYILQVLGFIVVYDQQYYFLIIYILLLYGMSQVISGHVLSTTLEQVSVLAIFLLGIYQTFIFQDYFLIQG